MSSCWKTMVKCLFTRIWGSCPIYLLNFSRASWKLAMKYHDWNTSCLKVSINICFVWIIHGKWGYGCHCLCPHHDHIHSFIFFHFIHYIGHDELGYLHIIEESHVDMLEMYAEVRQVVQSNWYGPKIYLHPIYRYYFVLLARKMKLITEKVFTQRTIPDLPVSSF